MLVRRAQRCESEMGGGPQGRRPQLNSSLGNLSSSGRLIKYSFGSYFILNFRCSRFKILHFVPSFCDSIPLWDNSLE